MQRLCPRSQDGWIDSQQMITEETGHEIYSWTQETLSIACNTSAVHTRASALILDSKGEQTHMLGHSDIVHTVAAILRHIEGRAGCLMNVHILVCGLGGVILQIRGTANTLNHAIAQA